MKITIALLAAMLPIAAAAQTPASVTVTTTHYCFDGSCHSHEYDMLQRIASAAKAHQTTVDGLRIGGTLAADSTVRTITADGSMPMPHPLPPEHPPMGSSMAVPNGMPASPPAAVPLGHMQPLQVHVEAQYRGTTLLRAAGELRDSTGRIVERFTVTP